MPFSARDVGRMVLLAGVYFIAGKLGLSLAVVHESASAVWPPTGIALATLLLLGSRLWPGVFVGAFLVNITTAGSVAVCLGIAAGNALEAVTGAWLVNRYAHGERAFERAKDVVVFSVLAGLVATTVSATLGVTSLSLGGFAAWADYGAIWLTWWLGDLGGALVVTPLLLLWSADPRPRWSPRQTAEAALLVLALVVVSYGVFSSGFAPDEHYPVSFLCLPILLWAVFRFGPRETAAAIVLLMGMAIWGTMRGLGPFGAYGANEALLLLQAFMGVTTVMAMTLASVILELRRNEEALLRTHDALERQVDERTAQLIQAAKLESVGQLAAGVAHEVKNPLAILLQGTDYLLAHARQQDGPTTQVLRYMAEAVRRADSVVRGLLDFSALKSLEVRAGDLNGVVDDSLRLVKHAVDRAHIQVVRALGQALPPAGMDRQKLTQVLVNLFMNAVDAMPQGGTLSVRTWAQALGETDLGVGVRGSDRFRVGEMVVAIAIEDTGSGVPEAVVEKVFDPFFTTKPSGQGTGLGLAVSKMIVELHGGAIDLRNRAAGGVQVTLWLKTQPVREAPRMARDEKRPATNRRGRGKLAGDRG